MKKVIFIHIAKAGGQTLYTIIDKNYDKQKICTLLYHEQIREFKNLSREEINRYDCVRGHFGFGLHEFFDDKINYITLLREPLERIISFYSYILRTPEHYLYQVVSNQKMTFAEFVESNLTLEMHNGQVRQIASENGLFYSKRDLENSDIERAKLHLRNHFAVVGPLDKFDYFLMLVKRIFGWSDISYTRQNVTNNKIRMEDIDTKTIEIVTNNNKLDFELYEHAKKLFEAKLRDYHILV